MKYFKKEKSIVCLLLLLVLSLAESFGQTDTTGSNTRVFALKDLEEVVFLNHPIVRQAALLSEQAQARLQQAWGEFDPALKSQFARKTFGNTEYYNNWSNELKVPLWVAGADLKIGYDRFVGANTNPQTRTGVAGLTGLGLSIPIGQGLLIDARRNTLRQSRIMVKYAEAEQVKQINSVWYGAVKDYWNWYYAYRQFELIREGADLALKRFVAVKNQTLLGDKPAIDSVEAAITFQERSLQLAKSTVELNNSRLLMSNHLWNDREQPLELPDNILPQTIDLSNTNFYRNKLDMLLADAASRHPQLMMLKNKGLQLQLERSYLREMLKPKLNLSASLITSRTDFGSFVPEYYDLQWSNYKLGVDFSFPLFLRTERGKIRENKVKQMSLGYDLLQTEREISTNILNAYNNLIAYESQLAIQAKSIENQQVLVNGELAKFDLGESTLFLINSRENKLIDMKVKMAELVGGYQKAVAELYYSAGTSTER
jgi:outer membrane protein TolC